jgi:HK97 family phage major capsid protein
VEISEIYCGDFSNLVLGIRSELSLEVSGHAGEAFQRNQTAIRLVGRFSVAVLNPTAFKVYHTGTAS